jgi:hypothetical protein
LPRAIQPATGSLPACVQSAMPPTTVSEKKVRNIMAATACSGMFDGVRRCRRALADANAQAAAGLRRV